MKMTPFFRGYVACALWAEMDQSNEQGGEPLDRNYSIDDIDLQTLQKMYSDCDDFQRINQALLEQAYARPGYTEERAGHDFWLTRNRHGAGFWDRKALEQGELGEALTIACRKFSTQDIYVGDDDRLHI